MLTGFGVDMVIDRVARGLGERGHEVTVYASVTDETLNSDSYRLKLVPTPASSFFPRYDLSAQRHLGFLNSEANDVYLVETFLLLPSASIESANCGRRPWSLFDRRVSGQDQGQFQLCAFCAVSFLPEICLPDRHGVGVPGRQGCRPPYRNLRDL